MISQKTHSAFSARTGYTLIELIIVVTILVILGTVGFISYSEFTINSRDSKRASDIVTIKWALSTYSSQKWEYPRPSNPVEIRATDATGSIVLMRQWVLGANTLQDIGVSGGGRDPSSNAPYTLSVDSPGKRAQVLAYFENSGAEKQLSLASSTAYAADDLSERKPVASGEKLWVFLQAGTLTPIEMNMTGSVAATSLAGSGYLILDGCLRESRLEPAYYTGALWEGACKNVPFMSSVLNSQGQDGDEIIAMDNRPYVHDPIVVAANGGDPNFFDRRYKLIKINGKWWMNQNLAYSIETDVNNVTCLFNSNPTSGPCYFDSSTLSRFRYYNIMWCPTSVWGIEECSKVNEKWYIYWSFYFSYGFKVSKLCPTGWNLPTQLDWESQNSWIGWMSPVLESGKWNLTPISWFTMNLGGVTTNYNTNIYQTNDPSGGLMYNASLNSPKNFVTFSATPYPWTRTNAPIRCIKG